MARETAFALINCYGNEACRVMYPDMAQHLADRYGRHDAVMRAWGPYVVREVAASAPRIVADARLPA